VNIPSKLIESAVNELSKLPGVGKRTALRFVLHLLKHDSRQTDALAETLTKLRNNIKLCSQCFSLSDDDICFVCTQPQRSKNIICIVEDIRDVMSVENTNQFKGVYHVLGGLISPLDGIGPEKLKIKELLNRIEDSHVEELILALPATIEGDTTAFYLFKQIQKYSIKVSTLAKGIAVGDQLEYADEITLGRSLMNRIPYEASLLKTY
jgi:recombination protein RecR